MLPLPSTSWVLNLYLSSLKSEVEASSEPELSCIKFPIRLKTNNMAKRIMQIFEKPRLLMKSVGDWFVELLFETVVELLEEPLESLPNDFESSVDDVFES